MNNIIYLKEEKRGSSFFLTVGGGTIIIPIRRDGGEEAEGMSNTPLPTHTNMHASLLRYMCQHCNKTCCYGQPVFVLRAMIHISLYIYLGRGGYVYEGVDLSVCLWASIKRREDAGTPAPSSQTHTRLFWVFSESASLAIMCADVRGLVGDARTLFLIVVMGFLDFSCPVFCDQSPSAACEMSLVSAESFAAVNFGSYDFLCQAFKSRSYVRWAGRAEEEKLWCSEVLRMEKTWCIFL